MNLTINKNTSISFTNSSGETFGKVTIDQKELEFCFPSDTDFSESQIQERLNFFFQNKDDLFQTSKEMILSYLKESELFETEYNFEKDFTLISINFIPNSQHHCEIELRYLLYSDSNFNYHVTYYNANEQVVFKSLERC